MLGVVIGMIIGTPVVTNAESEGTLLHKGMNHTDVKPLQRQLKNYDYYHDHIDGSFGPLTFKGVENFQEDHGLSVDGIAGPDTKKTLKKVKSQEQQFKDAPNLKRGSHNKTVKAVQKQLKHLNYYHSNLDGIYGPLTEKAVTAFQQSNHITIDGIAGPKTYSALIHNPVRHVEKNTGRQEKSASKPSTQKTKTSKDDETTKKDSHKADNQKGKTANKSNHQPERTLSVTSTAYTAHCDGCSGTTSTGINLIKNPGRKVIAVDPNVIPLGTRVWVEGYGEAVAGDTGGAIKGNRIDVFVPDQTEASNWGRKPVKVKILE